MTAGMGANQGFIRAWYHPEVQRTSKVISLNVQKLSFWVCESVAPLGSGLRCCDECSPMGMPSPFRPRSPKPRIRPPSVTTIASTSLAGQFHTMDACAGAKLYGSLNISDACSIASNLLARAASTVHHQGPIWRGDGQRRKEVCCYTHDIVRFWRTISPLSVASKYIPRGRLYSLWKFCAQHGPS